jgi:hypothetical protein
LADAETSFDICLAQIEFSERAVVANPRNTSKKNVNIDFECPRCPESASEIREQKNRVVNGAETVSDGTARGFVLARLTTAASSPNAFQNRHSGSAVR